MKQLLLLVALFGALPAFSQHTHVHGEGRLDVAIDTDTVTLELELPLDAAVGFERAPRNDKERAALVATERALNDASALWQPTLAANCTVQSVVVGMPQFEGGEHADVDAHYVFRCSDPALLKGIGTTIFKQFKRLYRLETQRIGPAGQGAQRLSPKTPTLSW